MIAIYCRVSTESQREKYSLPEQKKLGIEFAENIGEKYKIYEDVISGKEIKREDFNELLLDIEDKKIDKLWVSEQSRLERAEPAESFYIKQQLVTNGVEVYIDGSKIDFSNIYDDFGYDIIATVNRLERKQISLRTKRGLKNKKDKGEYAFSKLFGYRYKDKANGNREWVIEKSEAETIKLIYKYFFAQTSFNKIKNILNEKEILTRYGGKWLIQMVIKVMQKPQYAGYIYNSSKELIKSKVYPSIISLDDFQNAQRYWHEKRKIHPNTFRNSKHQSSSLIKCISCGETFKHDIVSKAKRKARRIINYYSCTHRGCDAEKKKYSFPETHIDFLFDTIYYTIFSDRKEIEKFLIEQKKKIAQNEEVRNKNLEKYEKLLKKNKNEKQRLIMGYRRKTFSLEDIEDDLEEIKKSIDEIQTKIDEIKKDTFLLENEFQEIIVEFRENSLLTYVKSTPIQKREILKKVVKSSILDENILMVKLITGKQFKIIMPMRAKKKADTIYKINVIGEDIGDFEVKTERDEKFKQALNFDRIRTIELIGGNGNFEINDGKNKSFIYLKNWIDEVVKNGKSIRPLS